MRILIGNDDGIDSPGLARLCSAAGRLTSDIWVVAPTRKWTAASHQLSFDQELELKCHDQRRYACSGGPADCIVAAMTILFADCAMPDLVLSGINDGLNIGEDAIYSGTLSVAREATLWGIPSIAFSEPKARMPAEGDCLAMAEVITTLWDARASWAPEHGHLLSVNLPARLPAILEQAAPGTDKIASATRVITSTANGDVRFELARGRFPAPRQGDQASIVQAGHIAVTRFATLASAPMGDEAFSAISRAHCRGSG